MKRSTQLIIGAFLAGLTALSSIQIYMGLNGRPICCKEELMEIPVDGSFNSLKISIGTPNRHVRAILDNINIEMNDSITHPVLSVPASVYRLLRINVSDGVLDIRLSTDSIFEQNMPESSFTHNKTNKMVLRMPAGLMKDISSDFGKLGISGINEPSLSVSTTTEKLWLRDCDIDTLRISAGKNAILKLRHSSIGRMYLKSTSGFVKIECSDSVSMIRHMDFQSAPGTNTDLYLNKAYIDTMRWIKSGDDRLTLRMTRPINILK